MESTQIAKTAVAHRFGSGTGMGNTWEQPFARMTPTEQKSASGLSPQWQQWPE